MSNKIEFNSCAEHFEEAFPVGNSKMGAMYYGGETGKLSLNLDSMWSGNGKYKGKKNCKKYYPIVVQLLKENKKAEAAAILKEDFYGYNSEGFLPLGTLYVKSENKFTDFHRVLDLQRGFASSFYQECGEKTEEIVFCSYIDNVLVQRISSKGKILSRNIKFAPSFPCEVSYDGNKIAVQGYCPEGCNPIRLAENTDTIRYACAFEIISDGELKTQDGITISSASFIEIRFLGDTSFYDRSVSVKKIFKLIEKANSSFDELFYRHIEDFSTLFSRSSLSISGDETVDKTETLFNFGKYLLISSSRGNSMPANLQGIWSESVEPIWYCAYTMNINLQMNYWGCEKVNLSECMEPLYRFVTRLKTSGEYTAKEYFASRGWCAFHNSDIWNMTTPVGALDEGDNSNYAWFLGAAGWLCHPVYQHYIYTLNKKYLEETALPIMRGAVEFYLDTLEEFEGEYMLIPGASPENAYVEDSQVQKIALCSAIDSSVVYGLFKNYIQACAVLGIDDKVLEKVKIVLNKINPVKVGKDGRIIEWDKEYEDYEKTHRHISHLYFNFPEDLNENGKYDDAIKEVMKHRGLGGTGWSIAWKINQFARLHDSETAYSLIKRYLSPVSPSAELDYSNGGGTYPNFFCAHPPFQIDGNFGVMSGIAEMLMQDNNSFIELMPAAASEWKSGEVNGFCAKNGFTVDFKWKNGRVVTFTISHALKKQCAVKVNGVLKTVKTNTQYSE